MTMLIMWLIELYLNDLGGLKEEGATAKHEDLEEEFRKFLAQTKVKVGKCEKFWQRYSLSKQDRHSKQKGKLDFIIAKLIIWSVSIILFSHKDFKFKNKPLDLSVAIRARRLTFGRSLFYLFRILKWPLHAKLMLANSCWQTQIGVCERHINMFLNCWENVGENRDNFYLSPTVCQQVVVSFTHTNLSLPTRVGQH